MIRRLATIIALATALLLPSYGVERVLAQAVPSIFVNPSSGAWGSSVSVTGSGFAANEAGISVTYDGTALTSGIVASGTGTWTTAVTIPFSTPGGHVFDASGLTTTAASVPNVTFTVPTPFIAMGRTSGPTGTIVVVSGSGFGASETRITVTFDSTTGPSGIIASVQGTWTGNVTIPVSAGGPHTIKARGASTLEASVPAETFVVSPSISMSRASGLPGSSVSVNGTGFGPSESGITVTYDGISMPPSVSAGADGTWSSTFTVPASAGGFHSIRAFGSVTPVSSVPELSLTISPTLSLSRSTGTPGTSVTVSGSGFAPGETGITVTYDGDPVGPSISARSLGTWNTTFTAPDSSFGSHSIRASGSVTQAANVPEASFSIVGGFTLSRSTGTPGSSVTVFGSGFAANESGIVVTFDGLPVSPGISATARGSWSSTITIPRATFGSHTVRAYGAITTAASDTSFNILGGISLSRNSGTAGSTITVNGSGFSPGESGVTVTYDGASVASDISANQQGAWSTTVTVPPSTSGPHTIRASGSATQAASVGDVVFTVAPSVSVGRGTAVPGSSITVNGSGFGAGEGGIVVTYNGNSVASGISANGQGSWSATLTVPPSVAGTHNIRASGSVTQAASAPELNLSVSPTLTLSRTSAAPGGTITVNGSGFGPRESGITVAYDGLPVATGISANAQGSWTTVFTIPPSVSGDHSVRASGPTTPTNAPEAPLTVVPGISFSQANVAPGNPLTITGSGFGPGETGITVTYDGNPVASGISANAQGSWTATFNVRPSVSGPHSIRATGSATQAAAAPEVTLNINPTISLSRTSAAPGTTITVAGSGFVSGETGISVSYDGSVVLSGISANAVGAWSATLTVPASVSGSHSVRAAGSITQANAPEVSLSVTPSISVNRASGAPGSSITVTGSGFGLNETGITVTYDGAVAASGVSAGPQGSWTATFIAPPSISGNHSIRASGSATQSVTIGEIFFSAVPAISVTPASGNVGSRVDISGAGFAPSSALKLAYDDTEIPRDGISTDPAGGFTKSFSAPRSKAGVHTVRVEDAQRNEARVSFTMENTPPRTPALQSPQNGSRIGIVGGAAPTLRWSAASDPSGVTYMVQVDTIPDFPQPVLEKTELTAPAYTLTESEALPRGEYYWRVRAVDGASNESAWSQAWALKSGLLPLGALLAIVVVAVGLAGGAAYVFLVQRRRRAAPAPEPAPTMVPGYWREVEAQATPKPRALQGGRMALPAGAKGARAVSPEEQARFKILAEFAQSLPLAEPGYNVDWLTDLVDASLGDGATPAAFEQLLQGQLVVPYQPVWTSHPLYQDLKTLLEGQPILQDLDDYMEAVNRCSAESLSLLQDVYRDAAGELPPGVMERGGWKFIGGVHADALGWFRGKSLREPSDRDYSVKPLANAGGQAPWLHGEETTSFAGPLIQVADEAEAARLRTLHIKLRRTYRASGKAHQLVGTITQLLVQRGRLLTALTQFGGMPDGAY